MDWYSTVQLRAQWNDVPANSFDPQQQSVLILVDNSDGKITLHAQGEHTHTSHKTLAIVVLSLIWHGPSMYTHILAVVGEMLTNNAKLAHQDVSVRNRIHTPLARCTIIKSENEETWGEKEAVASHQVSEHIVCFETTGPVRRLRPHGGDDAAGLYFSLCISRMDLVREK